MVSTTHPPEPEMIPGLELLGRGLFIQPGEPYDLRDLLWQAAEETTTYNCKDTGHIYKVPVNVGVNSTPTIPSGAALGRTTITESFEQLEKDFSVDANVAAGAGPFTVNASANQVESLRTKEQSVYAINQNFIPLWEVYLPDLYKHPLDIDISDVPTPFNRKHKAAYDAFFNKFGSHLVKRAWVGGKAAISLTMKKSESVSSGEVNMALNLKTSMGSGDANSKTSQAREQLRSNANIMVFGEGGDKVKLGTLRNLDNTAFSEWVQSIRENPKVIELEVLGIWNLIKDEKVSRTLAEAYHAMAHFEPVSSIYYRDQGELQIIRGERFSVFNLDEGKVTETGKYSDILPDLPRHMLHWDASFNGNNPANLGTPYHGKIVYFKGRNFFTYDKATKTFDTELRQIQGVDANGKAYWPNMQLEAIDAAINWGDGTAYFFSGPNYTCYDLIANRAMDGYPRPIKPYWEGIDFERIDAATTWDFRKAFFLRGNQYVRFDMQAYIVDPGYPKRLKGSYVEDWDFG
jgi:hypothetical protein